jgi:NAD(P)-dependent dehydrogenase (short-subunit alcohol dehydrogenase family)
MPGKLEGKVAVITGGNSGIGLASARLFVEEGAYVFITGRRQEELDQAVQSIGRNVTAVAGDVSKLEDIDRLYDAVRAKFDKIHIIFANAGVYQNAKIGDVTEEHYDLLFDVNVKGMVFTVQKGLPLLVDHGSILLTSSVASCKGNPGGGMYGASKAAVRSFGRTWTVDLADRGIRVNVISPGPIETRMVYQVPEESRKRIAKTIPLGRYGEVEEVAKSALFLASDDSSYITGIELFVDGGRGQI